MKLAYVEDDRDAREIFSRKLAAGGFACEVFGTAEALLDVARPGRYDILLIDIQLPGDNGIRLLTQLRQRGVYTPAIIITAFNSVVYAREALNSGANYLLEKPFSCAALTKIIRKVVAAPQPLQDCLDRGLAALHLSTREAEIAQLLLKGLSNKEIAQVAQISEKTVKQHITQLFTKSDVASRAEFFSLMFPV